MYLVNDDVIHILSNDDNFVFYYQKKKIEEKKIGGRERTMSLRMGFFLKFTTENDEIGIFVYKEKYVKK